MSRLTIVDAALVVAAGSVEGALREMDITYFQMSQFLGDAVSAVEFAARYRLTANERSCRKCSARMKIWKRKCSDSIEWRCMKTALSNDGDRGRVQKKKKVSCAAVSIRRGSVFESSRLPTATLLSVMFLWSQDAPQDRIRLSTGIAEHTAVDWEMFIREICAYYVNHSRSFAPRLCTTVGLSASIRTSSRGMEPRQAEVQAVPGTSQANFESYVSEFLFRRMTKNAVFPCLVDTAGRLYNPH
uniref:Alpha-type protein kinase domain-containing protein n=1 Tax=Ascaris lumbricoides TaxID=6252 RepID=A0A0M3IAN2_ASCLU